nr:hypothetical protein [Lachnospiraceae bacterium]
MKKGFKKLSAIALAFAMAFSLVGSIPAKAEDNLKAGRFYAAWNGQWNEELGCDVNPETANPEEVGDWGCDCFDKCYQAFYTYDGSTLKLYTGDLVVKKTVWGEDGIDLEKTKAQEAVPESVCKTGFATDRDGNDVKNMHTIIFYEEGDYTLFAGDYYLDMYASAPLGVFSSTPTYDTSSIITRGSEKAFYKKGDSVYFLYKTNLDWCKVYFPDAKKDYYDVDSLTDGRAYGLTIDNGSRSKLADSDLVTIEDVKSTDSNIKAIKLTFNSNSEYINICACLKVTENNGNVFDSEKWMEFTINKTGLNLCNWIEWDEANQKNVLSPEATANDYCKVAEGTVGRYSLFALATRGADDSITPYTGEITISCGKTSEKLSPNADGIYEYKYTNDGEYTISAGGDSVFVEVNLPPIGFYSSRVPSAKTLLDDFASPGDAFYLICNTSSGEELGFELPEDVTNITEFTETSGYVNTMGLYKFIPDESGNVNRVSVKDDITIDKVKRVSGPYKVYRIGIKSSSNEYFLEATAKATWTNI